MGILGNVPKKWFYLVALILTSLFFSFLANITFLPVEKTEKLSRVAILMSGESRMARLVGLRHGLEGLGFTEGKNIVYQVSSAGGNPQKLKTLAREMLEAEPDVIVVLGGLEADAVQQILERRQKEVGHSAPVVFAGVAAAAARGLYQNPQQPHQITGVENLDAELSGKRLEHFKRLLPGMKKVGVVYEPGIIPSEHGVVVAHQAAPLLGLEVVKYPVRSGEDVQALETTIRPGACDGLILMPGFIIESGVKTFYRLSVDNKIPVMGLRVKDASDYYFASFGPNVYQQGRQAARLVAKILNNTPLEDIPVETPDHVELVINLRIEALEKGVNKVARGEWDQDLPGTGSDEVGQLVEAFNRMLKEQRQKKELEERLVQTDKMASLGTVATSVAHEINNPLAVISGYSEDMLDRLRDGDCNALTQDGEKYLSVICDQTKRCKNIIRMWLDTARFPQRILEPVNVPETVGAVRELLVYRAQKKGVVMKPPCILVPVSFNLIVKANRGELQQVLLNLLINALDACTEGDTVEIQLEALGGDCLIRILDSGIGINAEDLQRIGRSFFTTKPPGQGTGLGIHIVRELVGPWGGTLAIDSEGEGRGTMVTLRRPLYEVKEGRFNETGSLDRNTSPGG